MDYKKLLGLIAALAIVLVMFVFAAIWLGFNKGEQKNKFNNNTSGNCSILLPDNVGSDEKIGRAIDEYIDKHGPSSPLKDTGAVFAKSGRNSNVNPALMVAIAVKESSLGTTGISIRGTRNPFGRTATQSQPHIEINGRLWYKFNSWDEAILEEGPYIKRMYVDDGRTTVSALVEKYCPRTECDTDAYVKIINGIIDEITQTANGALGTGCTTLAQGACGLVNISLANVNFQSARSTPQLLPQAAEAFNQLAAEYFEKTNQKLPVVSMFRTAAQQQSIYNDPTSDGPAKVCSSPHQAGWAFDAGLTALGQTDSERRTRYETLKTIASKYGWRPISSTYGTSEDHHFDHIPTKNSYGNVGAGIVAATCSACVAN